jgi:Spy/CpxP family protein refolding chaperone
MTMIDLKVAALAMTVGGAGMLGFGAYRGHGGFHGRGDGAMIHKFIDFAVNEKLDEVGASEAQKQKVREIKDRLVREAHTLRDDRKAFRDELLGMLEQDTPDAAQLKAAVRQRTEAFGRFAENAADAVVELHGVFTPEQRKKLLAEAREHMDRHRH